MKYWEIIADNLSKAGWSWGCVSAVDSNGRTMFAVDAHRDGKHFIVHADSFTINAGVGVPDAGSTLPLLGCALLGLAALRRKLAC